MFLIANKKEFRNHLFKELVCCSTDNHRMCHASAIASFGCVSSLHVLILWDTSRAAFSLSHLYQSSLHLLDFDVFLSAKSFLERHVLFFRLFYRSHVGFLLPRFSEIVEIEFKKCAENTSHECGRHHFLQVTANSKMHGLQHACCVFVRSTVLHQHRWMSQASHSAFRHNRSQPYTLANMTWPLSSPKRHLSKAEVIFAQPLQCIKA